MLRVYGDLNDHLTPGRRQQPFSHRFGGNPSVKEVIESLGIPHPEVDLILLNSEAADFGAQVGDGDRISVYPRITAFDLPGDRRLLPPRPRPARFALDGHLGQLARYLRMLGFDGWYRADVDDPKLAAASRAERRILLTRDRELLKRGEVKLGAFVRSTEPRWQLVEVIRRWDLTEEVEPFTRCIPCNGLLEMVRLADVREAVPPDVRKRSETVLRCQSCGHVYWHGSHVDRMQALVDWALEQANHGRRVDPS